LFIYYYKGDTIVWDTRLRNQEKIRQGTLVNIAAFVVMTFFES